VSAQTSVSFTGNSPDMNNMTLMFSNQHRTSCLCVFQCRKRIRMDYKHVYSLLGNLPFQSFLIFLVKRIYVTATGIFFSLSDNFEIQGVIEEVFRFEKNNRKLKDSEMETSKQRTERFDDLMFSTWHLLNFHLSPTVFRFRFPIHPN
jgi:hypothetical protein